ncbi:MAG: DUF4214 domain-containing protein [Methyloprofundus sp.]|nr:DUF4214 domain-containing protein [Methyloprofundus sp.]
MNNKNKNKNKKNILHYRLIGAISLSITQLFTADVSAMTSIADISANGVIGNSSAILPSLSADGRFIAFASYANNLLAGTRSEDMQIYLYDKEQGSIALVSKNMFGKANNASNGKPEISADGQYITFATAASDMDDQDTLNKLKDVFVYDRVTEQVSRVSSASELGLSEFPVISANGRFISYQSTIDDIVANDNNGTSDVFVYDRLQNISTRISLSFTGKEGRNESTRPSISADGRYITYQSDASNLVAGDNNRSSDVFVYDRNTEEVALVSRSTAGAWGSDDSVKPVISADGRFISYTSESDNLSSGARLNKNPKIFVYDRENGVTSLATINSLGELSNGRSFRSAISSNGRFVSYNSDATNLVAGNIINVSNIFVRDRLHAETTRISYKFDGFETESASNYSSISAHGEFIAFHSADPDLVPALPDVMTSHIYTVGPLTSVIPIEEYEQPFNSTSWPEGWYSYGWHLDSDAEGELLLRSNAALDNQSLIAEWRVTTAIAGNISFDLKVDSEQEGDFFRFYVDAELIAEYSGFIDWQNYQYLLSEGEHTLKFEYSKNNSISVGADAAWLDNVQFFTNDTEQQQTVFIERLYENILGRAADSGGARFWLGYIQSASATSMAFGFFKSIEFQSLSLSNTAFVHVLYSTVLGREADPEGLNHWAGLLKQGLPKDSILYGFFRSAEFGALAQRAGMKAYSISDHKEFQVKDFVQRFYLNVLGRYPEQEGLDHWANHLITEEFSAADVAYGFFLSGEFIDQNHDDRAFVNIAYATILNRSPDAAGVSNWLNHLGSGLSRRDMIQGFLASQEFSVLAASYGVVVQ